MNEINVQQFYGIQRGVADSLIGLGYAREAQNVSTNNGGLKTVGGAGGRIDSYTQQYETSFEYGGRSFHAWESAPNDNHWFLIGPKIVTALFGTSGVSSDEVVYDVSLSGDTSLLTGYRYTSFLHTNIGEVSVVILSGNGACPAVIEENPVSSEIGSAKIRAFGSGDYICSDIITDELTDDASGVLLSVVIERAYSDAEKARALATEAQFFGSASDTDSAWACKISSISVNATAGTTTITLDPSTTTRFQSCGRYLKIRGGVSLYAVQTLAMYYGRLFAAGDNSSRNRLYWSELPGDGRTIEDWSMDDASADTSGGHTDIGAASDPITALFALPGQLLIFKQSSLWRLTGAYPSVYTVGLVQTGILPVCATAIIEVGGVPYWLNAEGLWYYDGSAIQALDTSRNVQSIIREAGLNLFDENGDGTVFAEYYDGQLFFSIDGTLLVFDLRTGAITRRIAPDGKSFYRVCAMEDTLYCCMAQPITPTSPNQYAVTFTVDKFRTRDYAGHDAAPAVWESPEIDLGSLIYDKRIQKFCADLTGSVKITISGESGSKWEQTYKAGSATERRVIWATVEQPLEAYVKVRLESIDEYGFELHSGFDLLVDYTRRKA